MRSLFALLLLAAPVAAQDIAATRAEGLQAWGRIFAVTSHPRCTNCHVAGNRPMWEGLGYGENTSHGMFVQADDSRIGAETLPCRTCHVTSASPNTVPHAPPHIDDAWRLPPPELAWLGKTSDQVCRQLRDPATNDNKAPAELAEHVQTSAFVSWGFAPGAGRNAPAGTIAGLARDLAIWGAADSPCM